MTKAIKKADLPQHTNRTSTEGKTTETLMIDTMNKTHSVLHSTKEITTSGVNNTAPGTTDRNVRNELEKIDKEFQDVQNQDHMITKRFNRYQEQVAHFLKQCEEFDPLDEDWQEQLQKLNKRRSRLLRQGRLIAKQAEKLMRRSDDLKARTASLAASSGNTLPRVKSESRDINSISETHSKRRQSHL